ncbi:MAG: AAA family ATPase [Bacteroidales bacterium]
MLIRVFIKNFLSFDKETILSLYPGKGPENRHVVKRDNRDDIPALKAAIIYGANASGKSNLVKAVSFMKHFVTKGFPAPTGINYHPFKLSDREDNTSKIEFEIKVKGACYAYGVDFNQNEVIKEWLVKINKRSEQIIYERKNLKDSVKVTFDKVRFEGKENEQFAHFTGRGTPRNRLFLLEANRRNLNFITEINDVFSWFTNQLKVIFPKSRFEGLEFNLKEDKNLSESFTHFLEYFKTGVEELTRKEVDPNVDLKELPAELVNDITKDLKPGNKAILGSENNRRNYAFEKNDSGEVVAHKIMAKHLSNSGKEVFFELDEESDGTNRLIDFIPALIDLSTNDSVYVIDELDRSMHPILTRKIMEYFLNSSKENESQMIATTHESNLLDLELLRRDEIWFIEKTRKKSSSLYSLLEFKPRKEQNITRGYLNGRYGAIPFLSNPEELNW